MPPVLKTAQWLVQEMGVQIKVLAHYCNCHPTSLSNYINMKYQPTEKALRSMQIGIQQYLNELNEGVEL